MPKKPPQPVDLEAVREATAELERLARAHPELLGESSRANVEAWTSVLEDSETDMSGLKQIGIRWPEEIVARLDAYVEKVLAERPGVRYSRSDAVREFVERGLADEGFGVEVRRPKTKKRS